MEAPKLLTVEDIREALAALAGQLAEDGKSGKLVIVGGAAIALTLGNRKATKDIDGFIAEPEAAVMRAAAERVADQLGLPSDWLNDGAKGFMYNTTLGSIVFEHPSLTVHTVTAPQLLAMKLWAWRDDQDFEDAGRLLDDILATHPGISLPELWEKVEKYIPPGERNTPGYALEDLWHSKT